MNRCWLQFTKGDAKRRFRRLGVRPKDMNPLLEELAVDMKEHWDAVFIDIVENSKKNYSLNDEVFSDEC